MRSTPRWQQLITWLAQRRQRSGDLTGLRRLKFDVGEGRPERYRVLYHEGPAEGITIWAIGVREGREVYRSVLDRWIGRDG